MTVTTPSPIETSRVTSWTPRQREVLTLLARGRTNREIAEELGISLDGAKWHVSEIITRLGVQSRDEAAEYWRHENGWRMRITRVAGFATSGVGTYGHFAGELLKISSGADLLHVPYKGSGPALNDIAAGHVPLMMAGELVELAKAGKIRILATTNERRWHEFPDAPTMKESGFPQFTLHSWIGLAGPVGMPADIVAKLNAAAGKAMADPKAQEQLKTLGVLTSFTSAADFAQRIKADRDAYAEIVAKAQLKFE